MTSIALALLRLYKWLLSPLLPAACRFTPTCSEYAAEAITLHGPCRGAALALWRLLRCHPFSRPGFDPVPHPAKCHPERSQGSAVFATGSQTSFGKFKACHPEREPALSLPKGRTPPVDAVSQVDAVPPKSSKASRRDALKVARHFNAGNAALNAEPVP
jgi:hypothetical protein